MDYLCDKHYEEFPRHSIKGVVDAKITKVLKQGVMRPSNSPWSSPIMMVKKMDSSWLLSVDYRKLKPVTHQDANPHPRIHAPLDSLAGATYFTTLDLTSSYYQVEVDEHDIKNCF